MTKLFERSLLLRLGIAMATITVLALVSMGSSIFIAELMKGSATAINHAGSLRMQSYLIATHILAEDAGGARQAAARLDERLRGSSLTSALPGSSQAEARVYYQQLLRHWEQVVRPAAESAANVGGRAGWRQLDPSLAGFVAEVDRFVLMLEQDAEARIRTLRLVQGVTLFLILVVIYVTMYLMDTAIVTPLSDLLAAAERARRGDFTARVQHVDEDELGQLGRAFNSMADDLSKLYAGLESVAAGKAADLERSNRSLQLLYEATRQLGTSPTHDRLGIVVGEAERLLGLAPGMICLDGGGRPVFVEAPGHDTEAQRDWWRAARQTHRTALASGRPLIVEGWQVHSRWVAVALLDQDSSHGELLLALPSGQEPERWQADVIEALARQIGTALGTAQLIMQGRRLALLEERSVIARELHDSLAQSLSYLKIQISLLQPILQRGDDAPEALAVVDELRDGVNDAYRQLRELLTTFRLQMDGRGLVAALEDTVREFRARGDVAIGLDNRLQDCPLTVNEEIHVLQIVREALSNVVRHSRARQAEVGLSCDDHGAVTVWVDDDGRGVDLPESGRHHHGLVIMQERARGLGGRVEVKRREAGGTRVSLQFEATARRVAPAAI